MFAIDENNGGSPSDSEQMDPDLKQLPLCPFFDRAGLGG